jgi:colicin import membrane protein
MESQNQSMENTQINKKKSGRKAEVPEERIIDAGNKLLESGEVVTKWKLRGVIGVGGPDRLLDVWENYLSENGGIPAIDDKLEQSSLLPPEVEDSKRILLGDLHQSIEGVIEQINNAAVRAADKRVSSEYKASKEAKLQAEQELSDAAFVLAQVDDKVELLQEKIDETESAYRETSGELQSSKTTITSLEKQILALTNERDGFESKCNEQVQEISKKNVAIGVASNTESQLQKEISQLKSEKSQTEEKLTNAEANATSLDKDLSKTQGLLESSEASVEKQAEQLSELNTKFEGKLSEQSEQIGELKIQKETAETKVGIAEKQIKEFRENLVIIQNKTIQLTEDHEKELSSLTEQLEAEKLKNKK